MIDLGKHVVAQIAHIKNRGIAIFVLLIGAQHLAQATQGCIILQSLGLLTILSNHFNIKFSQYIF